MPLLWHGIYGYAQLDAGNLFRRGRTRALWLGLILILKITVLINLIVLLLVFLTNYLPTIETILPFQLAMCICGASHKCKLGQKQLNRTITLQPAPGGLEEVGLQLIDNQRTFMPWSSLQVTLFGIKSTMATKNDLSPEHGLSHGLSTSYDSTLT